jgi:quercetin dioxygenase-like cupin family protein
MDIHHAAAGEVMRLPAISDPQAKTAALVKADSFEAIHLVVRAGEHIPDHKVEGSMSLYCIEGEAAIVTQAGERRLSAGDWLYLQPGAPHAVHGITDAGLILTILFDRPTRHVRPPQS